MLMSSNAPWDGVYPLTLSVMDSSTAQIFPTKRRVVVSKNSDLIECMYGNS